MTHFFTAWRPDMTRATRDRVWSVLGLDKFHKETDLASDAYEDLYNEWLDRTCVAVLAQPAPAHRVTYRVLQATHLRIRPAGHVHLITYPVADIVHALRSVPSGIMTEGLQEVMTEQDLTPTREFLIRIMVTLDKRGWDNITIQFH